MWWYIADKNSLDSDDGDMYRVQHNAQLPPTDLEWKKAKDGVLPAPTLRAESGVEGLGKAGTSGATPAPASSIVEKLSELTALRDAGALDEDEFKAAKARLLAA